MPNDLDDEPNDPNAEKMVQATLLLVVVGFVVYYFLGAL